MLIKFTDIVFPFGFAAKFKSFKMSLPVSSHPYNFLEGLRARLVSHLLKNRKKMFKGSVIGTSTDLSIVKALLQDKVKPFFVRSEQTPLTEKYEKEDWMDQEDTVSGTASLTVYINDNQWDETTNEQKVPMKISPEAKADLTASKLPLCTRLLGIPFTGDIVLQLKQIFIKGGVMQPTWRIRYIEVKEINSRDHVAAAQGESTEGADGDITAD